MKGALRHCRALELAGEEGLLCGKILADLGADVIMVEPPGGDSSRRIGPFYKDLPDSEKSLSFFAYSTNKRSITLDIRTCDGQQIFRRLVQDADFLVESLPPGTLNGMGLGYDQLSGINPRLIMVSITPFGQAGPYHSYKSSDLVAMAMGGHLFLTGTPERPPVRVGFPQAHLHASAEGAIGAMIAYYEREMSGLGQHIDVSIQQSIASIMVQPIPHYVTEGIVLQRMGTQRRMGAGLILPQTWKCLDGFVAFTIFGGSAGTDSMTALVKWIDDEGMANDFIKGIDWKPLNFGTLTQDVVDMMMAPVKSFFLKHTVKELYEGSIQRRILLYPVSRVGDLLEDRQLKERDFWQPVLHEELNDTIVYPGPFTRGKDLFRDNVQPAPFTGQHNKEVYAGELGMPAEDLVRLKEAGVI